MRAHAESKEESFLVLRGECVLLVEGGGRPLREWDFVHCPPGTAHAFVGAGDGPCVILVWRARGEGREIHYPRDELAVRHGVAVEAETLSSHEAHAPFAHWRPGQPALPF